VSNEAINWAFAQPIKSSPKFVLVVMANMADTSNICWPSYKYLCEATGQDVKTVEVNLRKLRDLGYILDTNKRRGSTGRVIVYQLNTSKNGGIKQEIEEDDSTINTPKYGAVTSLVTPPNTEGLEGVIPPNFPLNTPQNGGIAQNVIPPNFPSNTPKFPDQYPQISHVIPPNLGVGTLKKPNRTQRETTLSVSDNFQDLLQDVQPQVLQDWKTLRKQKKAPITRTAVEGICREAEKAGMSVNDALATCCSRGWIGFNAEWVKGKTPAQNGNSILGKTGQATAANALRWLEKVEQKEATNAGV
jgi:hypothetical protein